MKSMIFLIVISSVACVQEKCIVNNKLRRMTCSNISSLPSIDTIAKEHILQLYVRNSNISNIEDLLNVFPSLSYIFLQNTSVNCSILSNLSVHSYSNYCNLEETDLLLPLLPKNGYTYNVKPGVDFVSHLLRIIFGLVITIYTVTFMLLWLKAKLETLFR